MHDKGVGTLAITVKKLHVAAFTKQPSWPLYMQALV
jgi:hypothetical protein